jgi:hypothetical protein
LEIEYRGFESYALPTISNFCILVKRAGRSETIGPICNKQKDAMLPGDAEYMWTDTGQIIAHVTLTPKGRK